MGGTLLEHKAVPYILVAFVAFLCGILFNMFVKEKTPSYVQQNIPLAASTTPILPVATDSPVSTNGATSSETFTDGRVVSRMEAEGARYKIPLSKFEMRIPKEGSSTDHGLAVSWGRTDGPLASLNYSLLKNKTDDKRQISLTLGAAPSPIPGYILDLKDMSSDGTVVIDVTELEPHSLLLKPTGAISGAIVPRSLMTDNACLNVSGSRGYIIEVRTREGDYVTTYKTEEFGAYYLPVREGAYYFSNACLEVTWPVITVKKGEVTEIEFYADGTMSVKGSRPFVAPKT